MSSVYEIGMGSLELDEFSRLTMTYTSEGFEELKNDISIKGQLVPIILREGRILDGRHRYKACKELGVDVDYTEVGCVSDADALSIVISNSLNKATSSDAAKVEAYLMCKAKGVKNIDMSKLFSRLNINYIRKISFIEKENPVFLGVLLRQNKVQLHNIEHDKTENYGTINGLWCTLKNNKKLGMEVVEVCDDPVCDKDYTVDLGEYFSNPKAEEEYWSLYKVAKYEGVNLHPGTELGKKIAGLIKSKYSSF